MKKRQKKNKILIASLVVIAALLISAGTVYGLFIYPQQDINSNKDSDTNTKESTEKTTPDKGLNPNTDTPPPTTKNEDTGKQIVQMVTYVDVSGSTVSIRGGINNAAISEGACFAQLTGPNGESIKQETPLLENASTTDCKTISLNTSNLAKGTWKYTLNYLSDTMEGSSNEASFEIR